MLGLLWDMTRGYRLRPWRSPYLKWRIETFSGIHAETIGFREFFSYAFGNWRSLWRYMRWAAELREGFKQ